MAFVIKGQHHGWKFRVCLFFAMTYKKYGESIGQVTFGVEGQCPGVKLGQRSKIAVYATSQIWFHFKITVTPTMSRKGDRKKLLGL